MLKLKYAYFPILWKSHSLLFSLFRIFACHTNVINFIKPKSCLLLFTLPAEKQKDTYIYVLWENSC